MPKEPEKPAGKRRAEDDEEERPAVTPANEPRARAAAIRPTPPSEAEDREGGSRPISRPTPPGLGVARPLTPTLTDPEELEDARRRSIDSSRPEHRSVTPVGALSLANARAPSETPPPKRNDLVISLRGARADWEALATAPPPPQQQALIDATALEAPKPHEPPPSHPATEREMNDRVSVGDFSGALAIAEELLERDPKNGAAAACAESCRGTLKKMYYARLGALDRVPVVSVARDQLRWLSIDHRAGFVLSLIDGVSTVEMLLDVTGMPELDALRILSELVQQRIISFR